MLTAIMRIAGECEILCRLAATCGWRMTASQFHNSIGKRSRQGIRHTNQHRSQQDRRTGMDVTEMRNCETMSTRMATATKSRTEANALLNTLERFPLKTLIPEERGATCTTVFPTITRAQDHCYSQLEHKDQAARAGQLRHHVLKETLGESV
jgi:hypothetical protein